MLIPARNHVADHLNGDSTDNGQAWTAPGMPTNASCQSLWSMTTLKHPTHPEIHSWGAFSRSVGTAPIIMLCIPGTPLKTTHQQKRAWSVQNSIRAAEFRTLGPVASIRPKQKRPWCTSRGCRVQNSGPWDPWLPVVENSGLFAQRTVRPHASCPSKSKGRCRKRAPSESVPLTNPKASGKLLQHVGPLCT